MQKTTENYQDVFLNQARKDRTMLTVFLMNGFAALDIHPHRRYVVDIGGRRSSRCRLHINFALFLHSLDFTQNLGVTQRLAWLRSRFARPVFDSLVLPLAGLFFVLSAQYGAVHHPVAFFLSQKRIPVKPIGSLCSGCASFRRPTDGYRTLLRPCACLGFHLERLHHRSPSFVKKSLFIGQNCVKRRKAALHHVVTCSESSLRSGLTPCIPAAALRLGCPLPQDPAAGKKNR